MCRGEQLKLPGKLVRDGSAEICRATFAAECCHPINEALKLSISVIIARVNRRL